MIQQEEYIIEQADKVMKDTEWPYEKSKGIRAWFKTIDDQIEEVSSQKNHPRFQEYVDTLFEYWTASMEFPNDEGWNGRNTYFIHFKEMKTELMKHNWNFILYDINGIKTLNVAFLQ